MSVPYTLCAKVQAKRDIGETLRKLCDQKGVEIIEAEACPDHIHMLVSIPPHISIAQFMGYLKGKSLAIKYFIFVTAANENVYNQ